MYVKKLCRFSCYERCHDSNFILTERTKLKSCTAHRLSLNSTHTVDRSPHNVHRLSFTAQRASHRFRIVCAPFAFRLRLRVESTRNHNCISAAEYNTAVYVSDVYRTRDLILWGVSDVEN